MAAVHRRSTGSRAGGVKLALEGETYQFSDLGWKKKEEKRKRSDEREGYIRVPIRLKANGNRAIMLIVMLSHTSDPPVVASTTLLNRAERVCTGVGGVVALFG